MPVCRILVIEDRQDSTDSLCRLLERLGQELGIEVDCTQLVRKNVAAFQTALAGWYIPGGEPADPNYAFDITSLDLIFQATPNMSQADGGAQLFAWLDQRDAVPNLGHLVVRSHQHSNLLEGRVGTYVHKETTHEREQWRELLDVHKRP